MPLPRYGGLDPDKRRHLMDVAVARFADKGYDGASLNEILAAAGFGKSSYYYYFADKEDLFATVIEDFWARVQAEIPALPLEALDAATFWPETEAFFSAVAALGGRHPHLVALAREVRALFLSPTPRLRPIVDQVAAQHRALLERGRALGCVRTDVEVDWLLAVTEAADQAVDERFLARGTPTEEAIGEHTRLAFDTFRRLVEPRHG
jgi:AcrR family transcriptional regulator